MKLCDIFANNYPIFLFMLKNSFSHDTILSGINNETAMLSFLCSKLISVLAAMTAVQGSVLCRMDVFW